MPLTRTSPRIHFDVHGQHGDEVVMVMGLGTRGTLWKPQYEALSRDHRVLTMDHRGLGESADAVRGPLTMRALAHDVERVIDEAGFTRPHLVGVSMGGMIAQELAVTLPSRFTSLTLIATHPGRSLRTLPAPDALMQFVRAVLGDTEQRRAALLTLLYTPEFIARASKETLAARSRAQLESKPSLPLLLAQISAVMRHDVTSRLSRLTMPVMLVRPGRDVLVRPEGLDRIAKEVRHARVLRFEDAGHGVIFEKAAELNDALRAFFAASSLSAADAIIDA